MGHPGSCGLRRWERQPRTSRLRARFAREDGSGCGFVAFPLMLRMNGAPRFVRVGAVGETTAALSTARTLRVRSAREDRVRCGLVAFPLMLRMNGAPRSQACFARDDKELTARRGAGAGRQKAAGLPTGDAVRAA